MKVRNMTNRTGRAVANQFIINSPTGDYFQSYQTIIVKIDCRGQVYLDKRYWDYSTITGKYRNQFLGETKRETEQKIKSGEYVLTNLN